MGGLTQIRLEHLSIMSLAVLVRGVNILDPSYSAVAYSVPPSLWQTKDHSHAGLGTHHRTINPSGSCCLLQYCQSLLHVFASWQLYSGTWHRGIIQGRTSRMGIISTRKAPQESKSSAADRFFEVLPQSWYGSLLEIWYVETYLGTCCKKSVRADRGNA